MGLRSIGEKIGRKLDSFYTNVGDEVAEPAIEKMTSVGNKIGNTIGKLTKTTDADIERLNAKRAERGQDLFLTSKQRNERWFELMGSSSGD